MKHLSYLFVLVAAVALLTACPPAPDETAATDAAARAVVEEIPVTTTSAEARELFTQGQHALDVGRVQDANALFQQAVADDPEFTYAYVNLMNAANSADEFMHNLQAAESSMASASEGEQLLVRIARSFVDVDASQRRALAQQLVEAYPSSPRAWLLLANIQTGLKEIDAARTSANKALELSPDMTATHRSLGFSYLFNEPKDFALGESFMKRVVELEPEEANARVDLGDAYRAQKRLEEARDAYAKGAELDRKSALAFSKAGHANTFLGNYEQARNDYAQAIEVGKDQLKVGYANFKACVHAYAGEPRAALDELAGLYDSIDAKGLPEDQVTGAKINVLTAQARIALHEGILDVAQRAVERRAEYVRAQAAVVGDEDFSQSQEANINWWAGELAARSGDYQAAVAKADEVARLVEAQTGPRKMEGYHSLMGLTHLLQGNHQEAIEHYRQADPDSFWVKHHLALALEATGESDEAAGLFQEVADWNFNSTGYACVRKDAIARLESAEP